MTCGPTANTQDLTSTTNLLALSGKFTFCFWRKLSSLTGGGVSVSIFLVSGGVNNAWCLAGYSSAGTPYLEYESTGTQANIGGGNQGTANWEWYAYTHDGAGTCKVYRSINGAAVALQLTQAVNWSGTAPDRMYLMNNEGNTGRTRGQVYGYKEWSDQLTLAELSHECFKIYPTRGTNLNRFIPALNNATAGQDYSGSAHSLTRDGAALTDSTLVPPSQWGGPQVNFVG
jgi:hypothetical protein